MGRRILAVASIATLLTSVGCGLLPRPQFGTSDAVTSQAEIRPSDSDAITHSRSPAIAKAERSLWAGPFRKVSASHLRSDEELSKDIEFWGQQNLQNGDLISVLGVTMYGPINMSSHFAEMSASRYSHIGIIVREGDHIRVRDITRPDGHGEWTLSEFTMEEGLSFGIKRLRPEYQYAVPKAVQFLNTARDQQVEFDDHFVLDDDRLYCAELVEGAYRSAGLQLSEPVRIMDLPGYGEHPVINSFIRLATNLSPKQAVIFPGNENIGIWSSPKLVTVKEFMSVHDVPSRHSGMQSGGQVEPERNSVAMPLPDVSF